MLTWLVSGQVIDILIVIMSGIGFFGLLVSGIIYSTLVKASEDMGFTESTLLKQIKLKYANCYKLEIYTNEVKAFIDRYLFKRKVLKVPLYIWEHIGLEMMYISMILGLMGTFINVTYFQQYYEVLPIQEAFKTGLIGFGLATILLVLKIFFALEVKKSIFYSNVTDYLENILRNKLEQQCKKEEIYETYEELEQMEKKNIENQKSVQIHKTDEPSSSNGIGHLPDDKQKPRATKSQSIKENLIEEVINQVISG